MLTHKDTEESARVVAGDDDGGEGKPALVLAFGGEAPRCSLLPLREMRLCLGREELLAEGVNDGRVSRRHLEVEHRGGAWTVRDCGSTNGTFLDGAPLSGERIVAAPRVARIGQTLLLFASEASAAGVRVVGDVVAGAMLQSINRQIVQLASMDESLHLVGETGSGKEVAARAFHAAAASRERPPGPFAAVNCATIPREIAERLLFGTRRGAYSGADADADGYLQAAHGGTLFLDEVGELDLTVQAKLLRVLERKEVLRLGATKPQPIDVRLCSATTRDLRQEVVAGRFREDLYFRIGRPAIRLPPLRERLDEIPWLIDVALRGARVTEPRLSATAAFVEACLLRPWPGNVRELRAEVRRAALTAMAANRQRVEPRDLDSLAGHALADEPPEPAGADAKSDPEAIEEALRLEDGNVTRAAHRLGIARSKLRRWLARRGGDSSDPETPRDE